MKKNPDFYLFYPNSEGSTILDNSERNGVVSIPPSTISDEEKYKCQLLVAKPCFEYKYQNSYT